MMAESDDSSTRYGSGPGGSSPRGGGTRPRRLGPVYSDGAADQAIYSNRDEFAELEAAAAMQMAQRSVLASLGLDGPPPAQASAPAAALIKSPALAKRKVLLESFCHGSDKSFIMILGIAGQTAKSSFIMILGIAGQTATLT